jgi:hypothetical protein
MIACNYADNQWVVVGIMAAAFFGKGIGALGWAVVSDTAPKEASALQHVRQYRGYHHPNRHRLSGSGHGFVCRSARVRECERAHRDRLLPNDFSAISCGMSVRTSFGACSASRSIQSKSTTPSNSVTIGLAR